MNFDKLYQIKDEERLAFGPYWCGGLKPFSYQEERVVANYPNETTVVCKASPSRTYHISVIAGGVVVSYTVNNDFLEAANTANILSKGAVVSNIKAEKKYALITFSYINKLGKDEIATMTVSFTTVFNQELLLATKKAFLEYLRKEDNYNYPADSVFPTNISYYSA